MKISESDFKTEIRKAMSRLPIFLREAVQEAGIAVVAEKSPPPGEGGAEAPFAYFSGPSGAEALGKESPYPPTIVMFRSTFESECRTAAEFREEIYRTLVHELGHFLGFEEESIEDV